MSRHPPLLREAPDSWNETFLHRALSKTGISARNACALFGDDFLGSSWLKTATIVSMLTTKGSRLQFPTTGAENIQRREGTVIPRSVQVGQRCYCAMRWRIGDTGVLAAGSYFYAGFGDGSGQGPAVGFHGGAGLAKFSANTFLAVWVHTQSTVNVTNTDIDCELWHNGTGGANGFQFAFCSDMATGAFEAPIALASNLTNQWMYPWVQKQGGAVAPLFELVRAVWVFENT